MQKTTHKTFYCRVAPSLGALDADHEYNNVPGHTAVWGTETYDPKIHKDKPTVFFGLYDLRDYIALYRHKGKAWVLWCGSDLQNLVNGFVFNDGKLKYLSKLMMNSSIVGRTVNRIVIGILKRKAEHWVEDEDEHGKLELMGIESKICPSFMGDIGKFPVSYKQAFKPKVYISGHPGREDEYGFDFVEKLAVRVPECEFHLFGAEWKPTAPNIVSHGRVEKQEFNRWIRTMQCGLRLNMSDGFSEITAKSVLMGQYPVTYLRYPMIPDFDTPAQLTSLLKSLRSMKKPNIAARNYYVAALNNYPWNVKNH